MSEPTKMPFEPIPVGGMFMTPTDAKPSFSRSSLDAGPTTGGLLPPSRKPVSTSGFESQLPNGIAPESTVTASTPPPKPGSTSGFLWDLIKPTRTKGAMTAGLVSLFAGAYGLNLVVPQATMQPQSSMSERGSEVETAKRKPLQSEERGPGPSMEIVRQELPTKVSPLMGLPALPAESLPMTTSAATEMKPLQQVVFEEPRPKPLPVPSPTSAPTLPPITEVAKPLPVPPALEIPKATENTGNANLVALPGLPKLNESEPPTASTALPAPPDGFKAATPIKKLEIVKLPDEKLPMPTINPFEEPKSTNIAAPAEQLPTTVKPEALMLPSMEKKQDIEPIGMSGRLPKVENPELNMTKTVPASLPAPTAAEPLKADMAGFVTPAAKQDDIRNTGTPAKTDYDVDIVRVRSGDTYASLAKIHYDEEKLGAALRAYNKGLDIGQSREVEVPPLFVLRKMPQARIDLTNRDTAVSPAVRGPVLDAPSGRERDANDPLEWGKAGAPRPKQKLKSITTVKEGVTAKEIAKHIYGSEQDWVRLTNKQGQQFGEEEGLPKGTEVLYMQEEANWR